MAVITATNQPTPVWNTGDGPVLLFNRDIANTIIWGTDSGIGGGISSNINEYHILDPLGTVSIFQGSDTIYVSTIAAGLTAQIDVIPNASDAEAGPVQIAESLSVAGISLLAQSTLLAEGSGVNVPASGSVNVNNLVITQIAYDCNFSLEIAGNDAQPWLQVTFDWVDANSGLTIEVEEFYFVATNTGVNRIGGRGQTKGDLLNITITNLSNTNAMTVSYAVSQNSRMPTTTDWRQLAWFGACAATGFITGPTDIAANYLFGISQSVASAAVDLFILPIFTGQVQWNVNAVPEASHIFIENIASTFSGAIGPTTFILDMGIMAANATFNEQIAMPRMNCLLRVGNTGAAAGTYLIAGTIKDY
jgi:hypothetical protein